MTPNAYTVSARAVLMFGNAENAVARISVPRARMDVTPAEALAGMQAMIDSGALMYRDHAPMTDIVGAKLVQTTRTQIA